MANDQTAKAALRDVVKIRELPGPRGGTKYVMELSCGCLVWESRPRQQVRCIPCWWKEEEIKDIYAQVVADVRLEIKRDELPRKWLIKRDEPTAGYSEIYFYPAPDPESEEAKMNHLFPWYRSEYSVEIEYGNRPHGPKRYVIKRRGARVDSFATILEAIKILERMSGHG